MNVASRRPKTSAQSSNARSRARARRCFCRRRRCRWQQRAPPKCARARRVEERRTAARARVIIDLEQRTNLIAPLRRKRARRRAYASGGRERD